MRRFRCVWIILLFATAAVGEEPAEPAPTKEAKVRRYLELVGADKLGQQVMDGMLATLRQNHGLPAGFLDKFQELARPQDLVELTLPIYAAALDEKTLDAAIAFYESPAGRALTKAQPQILRESMAVGAKWGQEVAMRALAELREPEPAKSRKPSDDMNSLRNFTNLLLNMRRGPPFKEGRLDVYALVRKGELSEEHFFMFRSTRFKSGPTDAEIKKEDYTNFPYGRFRGEFSKDVTVPLLWDKKPDTHGGRLIGLSTGAVRYYPEAEARKLLEKHGQLEPAGK